MADEIEFLRNQNLSLKAKIAGLEHRMAEMVRKHSATYELNEILQNRLRENGLSPYIAASDLKVEPQSVPASTKPHRLAPLTANMLQVLREIVDGTAVDHGRHMAPRERAGRGRTLDKLVERGLLDSAYRPTEKANTYLSSASC
ncbi:hypothetical protein B382_19205 [Stutzerimonas stutzeri B1SMN1]|uniref:hypothetical protein n=1 Tax=Ectopseudomonas oleovorans TaxID=301 RepID=UPI0003572B88|nr:hypothetical protein [Pseudomonas oleovorans]ELQ8317734.1 hypothetical protein [Pseudomonas aeruginosa]EPL60702.1 hypothetical protein B382_19205 [Stutzerimonas stutzeri B1SMN1]MBI6902615.1 hypothetical protein [Pseudomonas aeruginosa]HEC1424297.1 hypothetical protein [Pseudomonas aeruginosa]